MKKKSLLIIMIVALLLGVTGCGNSKSEFNIDNSKNIIEKEIKNLKVIEDETLEDVYNLDISKMEEHIFKSNKDGDFYAIIKTKDINSVKTNMKDYFAKVEKFNTNYSPERIDILNNRVEKEIDNYLIYIVSENAEEIYNKIIQEM